MLSRKWHSALAPTPHTSTPGMMKPAGDEKKKNKATRSGQDRDRIARRCGRGRGCAQFMRQNTEYGICDGLLGCRRPRRRRGRGWAACNAECSVRVENQSRITTIIRKGGVEDGCLCFQNASCNSQVRYAPRIASHRRRALIPKAGWWILWAGTAGCDWWISHNQGARTSSSADRQGSSWVGPRGWVPQKHDSSF